MTTSTTQNNAYPPTCAKAHHGSGTELVHLMKVNIHTQTHQPSRHHHICQQRPHTLTNSTTAKHTQIEHMFFFFSLYTRGGPPAASPSPLPQAAAVRAALVPQAPALDDDELFGADGRRHHCVEVSVGPGQDVVLPTHIHIHESGGRRGEGATGQGGGGTTAEARAERERDRGPGGRENAPGSGPSTLRTARH